MVADEKKTGTSRRIVKAGKRTWMQINPRRRIGEKGSKQAESGR